MGTGKTKQKKRAHAKVKCYKKSHATKRRARDVDQIQDDLRREAEGRPLKFNVDPDLPGFGQHYCTPCGRHFMDDKALTVHIKGKVHKRRLKDVAQKQYTQDEADAAAGMSKEVLPPVRPPTL